MARDETLPPIRISSIEKYLIDERKKELGYTSTASYIRALFEADIPAFKPGSKIKKARHSTHL